MCELRHATQGKPLLRNTQPFTRELGGVTHVFVHNGMLPGIETDARFATRRFRRIGDPDSEQAFCALMERMAPSWNRRRPSLKVRLGVVVDLAAELREHGPANFLYWDGEVLFAHGHRRKNVTGEILPPGLHMICRSCEARTDGVPPGSPWAGVVVRPDQAQDVVLFASVPLSHEKWEALSEGEVVVVQQGRIVQRKRLEVERAAHARTASFTRA